MASTTQNLDRVSNVPPEVYALEREFGNPSNYGFPVPVSADSMMLMAKTILAVAGADGEVSPTELNHHLGRGFMFGITPEQAQEIRDFDFRRSNVEELLRAVPSRARTVVLLEAIRIARTDGFADKERQAAVRAAQKLGIDAEFVAAVERNLDAEDRIRTERLNLLMPSRR
jgi:tellurite resistance protein